MYRNRNRLLSLLAALTLLLSFSGIALAEIAIGKWSSTVCMRGFTASDTLTKAAGQEWNNYYPKATSIRYADDGYSTERWMKSWVKARDGQRLCAECVSWACEDDSETIFEEANLYNTIYVYIQNYECYNTANMRSSGEFWASYGPDW